VASLELVEEKSAECMQVVGIKNLVFPWERNAAQKVFAAVGRRTGIVAGGMCVNKPRTTLRVQAAAASLVSSYVSTQLLRKPPVVLGKWRQC
jgi:hypothetical protein